VIQGALRTQNKPNIGIKASDFQQSRYVWIVVLRKANPSPFIF
jgi:hypothetical protein